MHGLSPIGLLTVGVVLLVMLLRLRGLRRVHRLRLETLWVVPAVLVLALGGMLVEHPPHSGRAWLALTAALLAGAGVGWWRGRLMRIGIDPATHALNQQASPAALLFVVLLIVARQGLRYEAAARGLDIREATGVLAALAVGLVAATRAEMFVRARALLAETRRPR